MPFDRRYRCIITKACWASNTGCLMSKNCWRRRSSEGCKTDWNQWSIWLCIPCSFSAGMSNCSLFSTGWQRCSIRTTESTNSSSISWAAEISSSSCKMHKSSYNNCFFRSFNIGSISQSFFFFFFCWRGFAKNFMKTQIINILLKENNICWKEMQSC